MIFYEKWRLISFYQLLVIDKIHLRWSWSKSFFLDISKAFEP